MNNCKEFIANTLLLRNKPVPSLSLAEAAAETEACASSAARCPRFIL